MTRQLCLDCGRPIAVKHSQSGTFQASGRGLCARDHAHRTKAGTLDDRPTRLQQWADYADDYDMLAGQGYPLDVIAARLAMTYDALDRALTRHRDDPRARRPATRKVG